MCLTMRDEEVLDSLEVPEVSSSIEFVVPGEVGRVQSVVRLITTSPDRGDTVHVGGVAVVNQEVCRADRHEVGVDTLDREIVYRCQSNVTTDISRYRPRSVSRSEAVTCGVPELCTEASTCGNRAPWAVGA